MAKCRCETGYKCQACAEKEGDVVVSAWAETSRGPDCNPMSDMVNDPPHYGGKDNVYEAIKVMLAWYGAVKTAGYCQLNAVKYLSRAGKKGEKEVEDLRKSAWYAGAAANILEHGKVR